MSDKSNAERLTDLCGFDPVKKPKVTSEIFKEVMGELEEERAKKAKEKARETIAKAIELREKMVAARKEFDKQEQKFEKELGKLLSQIEGDLHGQQPQVPMVSPPGDKLD